MVVLLDDLLKGRQWHWWLAGFSLVALTIILFLVSFRRATEWADHAVERLENLLRTHAFQRQMFDATDRCSFDCDDLIKRLLGGGA